MTCPCVLGSFWIDAVRPPELSMSFLSRAASGATSCVPPDAGAGRDDADDPGRYLTDGINLYRHLGAISNGMRQIVGLENCRTLDVLLVPTGELHARRFRPVPPRPDNRPREPPSSTFTAPVMRSRPAAGSHTRPRSGRSA